MLFTNATVITMNPTRDIIANGAVAVQGNRIVAVKIFYRKTLNDKVRFFSYKVKL